MRWFSKDKKKDVDKEEQMEVDDSLREADFYIPCYRDKKSIDDYTDYELADFCSGGDLSED